MSDVTPATDEELRQIRDIAEQYDERRLLMVFGALDAEKAGRIAAEADRDAVRYVASGVAAALRAEADWASRAGQRDSLNELADQLDRAVQVVAQRSLDRYPEEAPSGEG